MPGPKRVPVGPQADECGACRHVRGDGANFGHGTGYGCMEKGCLTPMASKCPRFVEIADKPKHQSWKDCEAGAPHGFLTSGERYDGQVWICPCGRRFIHYCDESEGCSWEEQKPRIKWVP